MTTNTNTARKVRVTSQQVAFLMLTENAAAVAALHAKPGHEIAPATFAAAVDLLASVPEKAAALAWPSRCQGWRVAGLQGAAGRG
jgi:hypothetical protein